MPNPTTSLAAYRDITELAERRLAWAYREYKRRKDDAERFLRDEVDAFNLHIEGSGIPNRQS